MYRLAGMGIALNNPTDTGAVKCGFFDLGVFNPTCWCLQHPSLCSSDDYVAAKLLAFPENIAPIQAPPTVKPPADIITPPASGDAAEQTISDVLAQQLAAWKAQNEATMQQTADNVTAIKSEYQNQTGPTVAGVPWWWWAVGGLGVFAVVAVGSGSPRRYGR